MRISQREHVTLYELDRLSADPGVLACFSARDGGVSAAPYDTLNLGLHVGDDTQAVLENRRRLARALGVEPSAFVFAHQVHGSAVALVGADERGRGSLGEADAIADVDALVTTERGVALAILVADCVPVILYDPHTPAVAVAHAGWRGTVAHVAAATVATMTRELGSDPATLVAAIGPSIGPDSYEVGAEVAERAEASYPGAQLTRAREHGGLLLDLWRANLLDLLAAGVRRANVEVAGLDTLDRDARLFSHRRMQPTGRFAAVAMLRDA